MMKNFNLVKTIGIAVFFVLAVFVLASCVYESVHYCVFCGKSGIQDISVYNQSTGKTEIHYKCTNTDCGKTFGAGKAPPVL